MDYNNMTSDWQSCVTSLTVSEEDFLFSLAVLAVFQLLILLLSVATIMLAWRTKARVLERIECKWTYDKVGFMSLSQSPMPRSGWWMVFMVSQILNLS